MKLKVGDKVRIKNNLIKGKSYGDFVFVNEMMQYKNKVSKIARIESNFIFIELDNRRWYWSEEMLEKVEEEKKMSKCKIYEMPDYVCNEVKKVIINKPCVVVILNSGEKGVAKCVDGDEFNESKGFDIAYHRAIIKRLENDAKHMKHNLKIITQ